MNESAKVGMNESAKVGMNESAKVGMNEAAKVTTKHVIPWEEIKGTKRYEAEEIVRSKNDENVKEIRHLLDGTITTMEYRPHRITLYSDASGNVVSASRG